MEELLPFQRQLITELIDDDGLVVLARGLGLRKVLASVLKIYAEPTNLVILLNANAEEEASLVDDLACQGVKKPGLRVVNNETPSAERTELYKAGGVLSITSRILVVDLLNKRVPIHLVTGILVNHAERVSEVSTEAFILRIYREENNAGFIKAFSDKPEALSMGFAPLEKILKLLYLRRVFIWPRFQVTISEDLEKSKADVIELRQPLSAPMKNLQAAIVECMDACLAELRKASNMVVIDEMTVENALFKSFDLLVRKQLDPVWHKLGHKTKQLVSDMKTLRKLLSYLVSYDCVTFHSFLEAILASNAPNPSGTLAISNWQQSPWLYMEAGSTIVKVARERVYRRGKEENRRSLPDCPSDIDPVLEEQPKWLLLEQVLLEIEQEAAACSTDTGHNPLEGPILVMVADERECIQIRELLEADSVTQNMKAHQNGRTRGGQRLLRRLLKNHFRWKSGINEVRDHLFKSANNAPAGRGSVGNTSGKPGTGPGRGGQPLNKRRRTRGGAINAGSGTATLPGGRTLTFEQEAVELASFISATEPRTEQNETQETYNELQSEMEYNVHFGIIPQEQIIVVRSYNGEDDDFVLEEIRPRYVIMYNPEPSFIRRVEVYKASHSGLPLRVYFLMYSDSVEEQQYLSSLRREKDSFERLIREKSIMAVRLDQDGRKTRSEDDAPLQFVNTRIAGGGRRIAQHSLPSKVIVDVREFRSSLPSLIHARGLTVVPCTLEVGDYVLSPTICVERKSISDLIGSFSNGRLYTQAESMCAHYKTPVLLIEFDQNKSFSLQPLADQKDDSLLGDLSSKIVLLTISFPQLRVLWSSSPFETAEMFESLKKSHEEPDAETAMAVGIDNMENIDSVYSITPQEMLRSLPGINSKNYRMVMCKVESLNELLQMPLLAIQDLIGQEPGKKLYDFVNESARSANR